jgi:hypothetical protein
VAGHALNEDTTDHELRDAQLDRDIGVDGGSIGEVQPTLPAKRDA